MIFWASSDMRAFMKSKRVNNGTMRSDVGYLIIGFARLYSYFFFFIFISVIICQSSLFLFAKKTQPIKDFYGFH